MDSEVFVPGQRVQHSKFGEGKVLTCDANTGRIVVDFITCGQKTLAVRLANLQIIK